MSGATASQAVWLGSKKEPFKTPAAQMQSALVGRKILEVRRVGKHIVVDLGSQNPSGTPAQIRTGPMDCSPWHDGAPARLNPGSREGCLTPMPPWSFIPGRNCASSIPAALDVWPITNSPRMSPLRVPDDEPLTVAPARFLEIFKGRKTPIKAALLNQKLLQGVGNIYADESLFRAGIRPRRMAGRLTHAGTRETARGTANRPARGDLARRILRLGLCRRGRREGLLPARAPGLPSNR